MNFQRKLDHLKKEQMRDEVCRSSERFRAVTGFFGNIEDVYILTNHAEKEITLQIFYPFVSNLISLEDNMPVLDFGTEIADTELYIGGSFGTLLY